MCTKNGENFTYPRDMLGILPPPLVHITQRQEQQRIPVRWWYTRTKYADGYMTITFKSDTEYSLDFKECGLSEPIRYQMLIEPKRTESD